MFWRAPGAFRERRWHPLDGARTASMQHASREFHVDDACIMPWPCAIVVLASVEQRETVNAGMRRRGAACVRRGIVTSGRRAVHRDTAAPARAATRHTSRARRPRAFTCYMHMVSGAEWSLCARWCRCRSVRAVGDIRATHEHYSSAPANSAHGIQCSGKQRAATAQVVAATRTSAIRLCELTGAADALLRWSMPKSYCISPA
jgi:hypothetical protein